MKKNVQCITLCVGSLSSNYHENSMKAIQNSGYKGGLQKCDTPIRVYEVTRYAVKLHLYITS